MNADIYFEITWERSDGQQPDGTKYINPATQCLSDINIARITALKVAGTIVNYTRLWVLEISGNTAIPILYKNKEDEEVENLWN